jgi:Domain of unknown function (DUF5666)
MGWFRSKWSRQRPQGTPDLRSCLLAATVAVLAAAAHVSAQDTPASAQISKTVGVIKSVQTDSITVAPESGGDVRARLTDSTKILRVPPGEKDLKNATALQLQDLQPGDRVLVRGQATTNGDMPASTVTALAVIVMKQADVAAKQQHERDDWQKRGVGGLVTRMDAASGTITISAGGVGANHDIAVHIAKNTILRRYPPGSVKFDEAKPAPVDAIRTGDQLRARGARSADGGELTAEEIVSGSFRNIAGTIKAIDTAAGTMTVQDAISKSAVVVKVSSDSQMKRLPAEMAQRIAMRLKGAPGGDPASANGPGQRPGPDKSAKSGHAAGIGAVQPGSDAQAARGAGGNGPPDLQRMLGRLPNSTLAELQKGDAVMIVSSEAGNADAVTAITLLAGVEPILTANRSASFLLSPWSLNTTGGEGEGAQ